MVYITILNYNITFPSEWKSQVQIFGNSIEKIVLQKGRAQVPAFRDIVNLAGEKRRHYG